MLMMGRLMLGKRSMGSRPRVTNPRMAMPSEAMRMATEFLRARNVIHMLLLQLRADFLSVPHQLLSLDDHPLLAGEPLGDFHERALAHAGDVGALGDDPRRIDDVDDRAVALV